MDQIEKTLSENQWLGGQQPSAADREAYEANKGTVPDVAQFPHAFAWWCLVAKFTDAVRESWAAAGGAAKGKAAKAPAKKEEPKKEAADDEFDPFADDGEEDAEVSFFTLNTPILGCRCSQSQGRSRQEEQEGRHCQVPYRLGSQALG